MSDFDPPPGGTFLHPTSFSFPDFEPIFAPEQFSADARLLAKAVDEFVRREVVPVNDRLEAHEPGLMALLLRKAGEIGLLGVGIPEAYGGLDLPKSQIALLAEKAGIHPSFAISAGVHAGVAAMPLLFFGTPEQRRQYLPRIASGEWIAAFALSEADSGSDALGAQARATLSLSREHYVLNGAKMWITNGAFADLLTVFALVEGKGFSAFLVERGLPGVSVGREEKKLGLHGSSTTRIVLEGAEVPAANLLGEIGKGSRSALYSLNLGRLTIAATALGMCKECLSTAVHYAKERRQFGRPIVEFGLVRQKLARMAIRTFVLESMLYRTTGYLDRRFAGIDAEAANAQDRYRSAAEEYAIECAILKVYGTETLDFVVDEALQIHGGYGYSEEFEIARTYRDARVFRIFEGTNEINRITIVDQLLRRLEAKRLPDWEAEVTEDDGANAEESLSNTEERSGSAAASSSAARCATTGVRKLTLGAISAARMRCGAALLHEQEVVGLLADLIISVYAVESAELRCRGIETPSEPMTAAARAAGLDALMQGALRHGTVLDACEVQSGRVAIELPQGSGLIALERRVAAAVEKRDGYPWQTF